MVRVEALPGGVPADAARDQQDQRRPAATSARRRRATGGGVGSPSGGWAVSGEGRAPGWVRSGSSGSTRGARRTRGRWCRRRGPAPP